MSYESLIYKYPNSTSDPYNYTTLGEDYTIPADQNGVWTLYFQFLTTTSLVSDFDFTSLHQNYYSSTGFSNDDFHEPIEGNAQTAIKTILKTTGSDPYSVYFGDVAKIVFSENTSTSDPNAFIGIGALNNDSGNPAGFVGEYAVSRGPEVNIAQYGDLWLNQSSWNWQNALTDSALFDTLIHELGHSLGLKHPNDSTHGTTDSTHDNEKYTVMSYNHHEDMASGIWAHGLQLYDIAAIQSIYGVNTTTRNTNTTYSIGNGFGATASTAFIYTIWDGGAVDKIDATGYSDAVQIDLRQGQFSSIGKSGISTNAVAFDSSSSDDNGNVAIAYNTVIENAVGTGQGDIIVGNAWNSTIWGAAGNDRLYGDGVVTSGTSDIAAAGDAGLNATASGDSGADTLYGEAGLDLIYGGDGADLLDGGADEDIIYGGTGNDSLAGGTGADTMYGGIGDDVFDVDNSSDVVNEDSGEGTDTVRSTITFTLGATFENLTLTGSSNINGTGNTLGNVLTGNSGNNTLTADSGNDTFIGSAGTDSLAGDAGTDTADYSALTSAVTVTCSTSGATANKGVNGTDTLSSVEKFIGATTVGCTFIGSINGGNLFFYGGNASDLYSLAVGQDTGLIEVFDSGGTADVVNITGVDQFGGSETNGRVSISFSSAGSTLSIFFDQTSIIQAGSSVDFVEMNGLKFNAISFVNRVAQYPTIGFTYTADSMAGIIGCAIDGDSNANYLAGYAVADTLDGRGGADTLDGGAGADTMMGGTGDDTYTVDNTGDVIIESASEGTDTVYSSVTYTLSAHVENLILTGSSNINGTGNSLAGNVITGNIGNNTLDGGTGADTMSGGNGNDTYVVDDASDVVTENAGEGTDAVLSSVSYALGADLENLTLTGGSNINGTGNSLDNVLTGNSGTNTLTGGTGNDTYVTNDANDVIIENADEGSDVVQTSVTLTLASNVENLTLTGSGNIAGTGNSSANVLTGNSGNNTLDGGGGADTMAGGAGDDIYVVDDASDVVTESASEGTDTVLSSITYALGSDLENLTLMGNSNIDANGNGLNNILTGNSGVNTLAGGTGNDTYVIDGTSDVIVENASEGMDVVQSSVSFTLGANVESLTLTGSSSVNGTGNRLTTSSPATVGPIL
jgi:Ca2+-binding RTX toxin-like protein